jgi:hypothetical protein
MSLLRLLTTGKSLVSVSDAESRYRVTRERLLPQFGSAGNPFTNAGKSDPTLAEARASAKYGGNGASGSRGGTPSASEEPAAALARGALRSKAAVLLSRWMAKIGGLRSRPRAEVVKPAIPRFAKPPVQAELSLDKIQVVRNDLSDADLEVVPAKAPAARATEEDVGAETALGRVKARILGIRKP